MHKNNYILFAITFLFFFGGLSKAFAQQKQIPFSPALHGNVDGYLEYLPQDYSTSGKKYPLILFLHGSGEAGSQGPLSLVAKNGPPELIAAGQFPASVTVNGQTFSFIVLSPQFINWPVAADVDAFLQYAESKYRIDASRIYLTGLSMGGGATWDYAQQPQYGSKIAAISVIAGAQPPSVGGGCTIAGEKMGVWAFNNSNDPEVSPSYTTDWVSYVNACKPPFPAIHTVWPNQYSHGGWVQAYDPNLKGTDAGTRDYGMNMYQWFLQFQLGSSSGSAVPANKAPVANAGANQTITLPTSTVTLNGTSSADPDGSIGSYAWSLVSGPAGYSYAGSTSSQPVVSGLTLPGTYVFSLSVKDLLGLISVSIAKVTIIVNPAPHVNVAPVANAGAAQTITLPVNQVTLNGTGSADADGSVSSYAWSLVSGPSGYSFAGSTSSKPVLAGLIAGTYVFALTVKDNLGLTSTSASRVTITVKPAPHVNEAPVANAGVNQSITLPVSQVTLDGSRSSDPDGTVSRYLWSLVSGPTGFTFGTSASEKPVITGLSRTGSYVFRLSVFDNAGLASAATSWVTVTVNPAPKVTGVSVSSGSSSSESVTGGKTSTAATPPNKAPISVAGPNQTITQPVSTVTLNGTGSSDPDGTVSKYLWSLVSAPSGFTYGTSTAAKPVITGLTKTGNYVFRLSVFDNQGLASAATSWVTITVRASLPPVANAGPNQTIILPTSTVTLDGTASKDQDGAVSSYLWSLVSGPSGFTYGTNTASRPVITGLTRVGTYIFRLSVFDNTGLPSAQTSWVYITVKAAANQPPVANAGPNQTITLPTSTVTLNGTASKDPDGTVSSYLWSLVSGPAGFTYGTNTASRPVITGLTRAGTYIFRLSVFDNAGLPSAETSWVYITVKAAAGNQPPVANAGPNQTITLPTSTVTLDGTASKDPDGTVSSYLWSLVSGPSGFTYGTNTAARPVITGLTRAGTYIFRLSVFDNAGLPSAQTAWVYITVKAAAGNQLPVANAGVNQTITLPTTSVTLDGSASKDPDGTVSQYIWSLVTAPAGFTYAGSTIAKPVISNLDAPGSYTFALRVVDNSGASSAVSASVTITVNSAVATNPGGHKRIPLKPDVNGVLGIDNVTSTLNPQPGDTLCLAAGNYSYIYLGNIHGTAALPIIIINCGGLVKVGVNQDYTVTFQLYNSTYFKLQGTGVPSIEYGFDISGIKTGGGYSDALTLDRGASDFELNNLYIHDAGHFIISEQRADCADPQWWRENYTMKNISFHHIKGNNSVFEGFYIGCTDFTTVGTCGTMNNNLIENMQVYDNIITNTGNAGIQVAMAWLGTNVVHHNYIKNFGTSNSTFQTNGMEIGGGCHADVYDNYIDTGVGNGMQVLGGGLCRIYNNIIVSPGADGIQLGQRILFQPLQAQLVNNTIVNAGVKSISVYDTIRPTPHQLYNNLLVHQGSTFNRGVAGIDATPQVADMQNNLYLANVADAKFLNQAADDFHLTSGSPAIDKGKNVSSLGFTSDYDGNARPYNGLFDIGAFEYRGSNQPSLSIGNDFKLADLNTSPSVSVYPNPFSSQINVSLSSYTGKTYALSIYDVHGALVYSDQSSLSGGNVQRNLNLAGRNIVSGIYILRIQSDGVPDKSLKIVKY